MNPNKIKGDITIMGLYHYELDIVAIKTDEYNPSFRHFQTWVYYDYVRGYKDNGLGPEYEDWKPVYSYKYPIRVTYDRFIEGDVVAEIELRIILTHLKKRGNIKYLFQGGYI